MTYPPPTSRHRRSPLIERTEPGKLPAAFLAIIVHGAFFALLVFGVSWQVKHPAPAIAELWDQLPPIQNVREEPTPPVPIEPEVVSPPKVEPKVEKAPPQPTQADINLQAKRAKLEKEEREKQLRDEKVLKEKQKQAEVEKKRKEDEAKQKTIQKIADDKARAEQVAKEAAAARNASLNEYGAKIAKLIKDRANIPDSVTGRPEIQVRVKLLVNGAIFDAQVVKPSGDKVYDDAVERAINGIRNWPQPESAELFGGKRELILNIRHER